MSQGAPPSPGMVMVPTPCGGGCVWGGGFENEKLRFDCGGASGSRVNGYKSHHSLTETFSQRLKGKLRISSESVVAGRWGHTMGGSPNPGTWHIHDPGLRSLALPPRRGGGAERPETRIIYDREGVVF